MRDAMVNQRAESSMDKLEEITRKRKHAHAKLQALGSKVYEAFLRWSTRRSQTVRFPGRRRS